MRKDEVGVVAFLEKYGRVINAVNQRRIAPLGFNAFSLMSDTYRRENFHSDVIRGILDPNGEHGEGAAHLHRFLLFIASVARRKGNESLADQVEALPLSDDIDVVREEGRVDIKIKAPSWTILIENKINGACDMERQIPRYLKKNGEIVKAVVYLTTSQEGEPSQDNWTPEEIDLVKKLLIPIVGYSETPSQPNLVRDWLQPCEFVARDFNTKAVLNQYSKLVIHQAGVTMNEDAMKKVLDCLNGSDAPTYTLLRQVVDDLPKVLARQIEDRFKGREDLQRAWVYKDSVAVFDFPPISCEEGAHDRQAILAIDVNCEDIAKRGVSFFSRSDNAFSIDVFLRLLQRFDSAFKLHGDWGRIVLSFDPDGVFNNVEGFMNKLEQLLAYLLKNRRNMAVIVGGKDGVAV